MPNPNDVYRYEDGEVQLIARHTGDNNIWMIRWLTGTRQGTNGYLPNRMIEEELTHLRNAGGAPAPARTPAVTNAADRAVPVIITDEAVPAATPARRRRAPRGRRANSEDPDELAQAPAAQRQNCPHCREAYTGTLGADHSCAIVTALKCPACSVYSNRPLYQTTNIRKVICPGCKSNGWKRCKDCGDKFRNPQEIHCNQCLTKFVRQHNIFRGARPKKPRGSYVISEARSHRPFSVELETYRVPADAVVARGRIQHWVETGDGSIQPGDPTADEMIEFRAGPFIGDGGLDLLSSESKLMRDMGFRSNVSCGLHVHVDLSGTTQKDRNALRKFGRWFQDDAYKMVAPSRRSGTFSRPLEEGADNNRYLWMNLQAFQKFGTVEYRLHHGVTQPEKIVEWVKICLLITEVGMKVGRLSSKPSGTLYNVLELTPYEVEYWDDISAKLHRNRSRR